MNVARARGIVFAVAALVRAILLSELRSRAPTFYRLEGGDCILYDRLASGYAEPARAFFHSPLYIGFLTALYRAFGRNLVLARTVQLLLGSITAVMVFELSRRLSRSNRVALGAGLAVALMGPVAFYEAQIAIDALMPFLLVANVFLYIEALRTERQALSFAAGVMLGLAAVGRAVALLWLPVEALMLLVSRGRRTSSRVRRVVPAALLVFGAFACIAPVTLRNWQVEHVFVPISANGGLNLFIGNNPQANGAYVYPEGLWFRGGGLDDDYEGFTAGRESTGTTLNSAQLSTWWTHRAIDFATHQPRRELWLLLQKLQLLVSRDDHPQLHDYDAYGEVAPILRVLPTAAWILVPGLCGVLFALVRPRSRLEQQAAILTVLFALGFLPFFVVGRYRAAWLVLLAPFAASFVVGTVSSWRAAHKRSFVLRVGGLGLAAAAAFAPIGIRPNPAFQFLAFANASRANRDLVGAEHWARRAAESDPHDATPLVILASLRRQEHRNTEALALLDDADRAHRGDPAALRERGFTELALGHDDEARVALEASLDQDPGSPAAWMALASALDHLGRNEDAAEARRSAQALQR